MDALDGLLLASVAAALPSIVDIVQFASTSRRIRAAVVQGASDAWRRHADALPPCPQEKEEARQAEVVGATGRGGAPAASHAAPGGGVPAPPPPPPPCWCAAATLCRQRLVHWRAVTFARRDLERLNRESEVATAERLVRGLTREAAAEEQRRAGLAREAAALLEALREASPPPSRVPAWAPSSAPGGSALSAVVAMHGVDARVRLRQLDQELALCGSRAETLSASLGAARRALARARAALAEAGGQLPLGPGGGGRGGGGGMVCPTPLLLY
jgi:hypothetical protein